MDRQLYNKLIQNISKSVKQSLIENIQDFSPADYNDDEQEIINNQTIKNVIGFTYTDFNIIVNRFNQLKIPRKLKLLFSPTFSITETRLGWSAVLYSYNFHYNQKDQFASDMLLKSIERLKRGNDIQYELIITLDYYNSCYSNDNSNTHTTSQDQYMTLIRDFVFGEIKDINVDWTIHMSKVYITCKNAKPAQSNKDGNGIVNSIEEGFMLIKEVLNKYVDYLEEHTAEIKNIR